MILAIVGAIILGFLIGLAVGIFYVGRTIPRALAQMTPAQLGDLADKVVAKRKVAA